MPILATETKESRVKARAKAKAKKEAKQRNTDQVSPLIKWTGGKYNLALLYAPYLDHVKHKRVYIEPFFGGGAVFWRLLSDGLLDGKHVILSDANPLPVELIAFAKKANDEDFEVLCEELATLLDRFCMLETDEQRRALYWSVRATRKDVLKGIAPLFRDQKELTLTAKLVRFLFLNRTCYNGLYRENSDGEFNSPLGIYLYPIYDFDNLRRARERLKSVDLKVHSGDFARVVKSSIPEGNPKDCFVYFDPPYDETFSGYTKACFTRTQQIELRDLFTSIASSGGTALLSNSDTDFVNFLYRDYPIEKYLVSRTNASKLEARGTATEVLVIGGI